jgi:hypothetical protein
MLGAASIMIQSPRLSTEVDLPYILVNQAVAITFWLLALLCWALPLL